MQPHRTAAAPSHHFFSWITNILSVPQQNFIMKEWYPHQSCTKQICPVSLCNLIQTHPFDCYDGLLLWGKFGVKPLYCFCILWDLNQKCINPAFEIRLILDGQRSQNPSLYITFLRSRSAACSGVSPSSIPPPGRL